MRMRPAIARPLTLATAEQQPRPQQREQAMFTEQQLKARPRTRPYSLPPYLEELGLTLRISPSKRRPSSGSRSWTLSLRLATGKRTTVGLGGYPKVSLVQARLIR